MSVMEIGKLNKRITIQKLGEQAIDSDGFPIANSDGWSDFKTVWSSVNNLFGAEFWSAKAVNEEDTKNFIVRYSKDIDDLQDCDGCKKYRIIYRKKIYDITFADNMNEDNTWYKLKAKAVN